MSGAAEVLGELRTLGIDIRPNAGGLRLDGNTGRLTAELRARVIEAKPELLELLTAPSLDHGLAVREVLGFPAALLGALPLPATLLLDMPGGGRVTVATHTGCPRADLTPTDWLAWCSAVPSGTVAAVLATRGATLRMVAIEGER
jgi:hypothetical protein